MRIRQVLHYWGESHLVMIHFIFLYTASCHFLTFHEDFCLGVWWIFLCNFQCLCMAVFIWLIFFLISRYISLVKPALLENNHWALKHRENKIKFLQVIILSICNSSLYPSISLSYFMLLSNIMNKSTNRWWRHHPKQLPSVFHPLKWEN